MGKTVKKLTNKISPSIPSSNRSTWVLQVKELRNKGWDFEITCTLLEVGRVKDQSQPCYTGGFSRSFLGAKKR